MGVRPVPRVPRPSLMVAGGVAIAALVVIVVAFRLADINSYKPQLEAAGSRLLGLDVTVRGRIGIDLLPSPHLTLNDVHLSSRGSELCSSERARLWIDWLPLLRGETRIDGVALAQPRFSIARARDGAYNVSGLTHAAELIRDHDLPSLSMADGSLLFTDAGSGTTFELRDFDLSMKHLRLHGGGLPDRWRNPSFTARFDCREARSGKVVVSGLELAAVGRDAELTLDPITLHVFGGDGSGSVRANLSDSIPVVAVRGSLRQFRIEEFFATFLPKKTAEGAMDLTASLAMRGRTTSQWIRTASGEVTVHGRSITLDGGDLDKTIQRFDSSQSFNLVDLGALFLAGPFGPAVTKGVDFGRALEGTSGGSRIGLLVSRWRVGRGVAQAQDVAMATNANRIAMQGGLDFASRQFSDVTFAVVDANGCARVQQRVRGPFAKPVIDKPEALVALVHPVLHLLGTLRGILPAKPCVPFYTGSVPPPEAK